MENYILTLNCPCQVDRQINKIFSAMCDFCHAWLFFLRWNAQAHIQRHSLSVIESNALVNKTANYNS